MLASFDDVVELLLAETTTLGVRYHEANRRVLQRTFETVETGYGSVRMKVAADGEKLLHAQPEYEDVARIAGQSGAPFLEVQAAATAAYREKLKRENDKRKEE